MKYLASRKLTNSLSPKSTKPKRVRKSKISFLLIEEVARIRYQYPRMGKSKLKVFLVEIVSVLQNRSYGELVIILNSQEN